MLIRQAISLNSIILAILTNKYGFEGCPSQLTFHFSFYLHGYNHKWLAPCNLFCYICTNYEPVRIPAPRSALHALARLRQQ